MKRLILLLLTACASAQVTPNLHLNLPPTGTQNWGPLINQNFSLLDTCLTAGTCTGPVITFQTNGTSNGTQGSLNLVAGANITLTNVGNAVTIAGSGGGGGGGNVTTTPGAGASQIIQQQANTQFAANNADNIRYAYEYNWSQSPSGSLTGGVLATVTLTPCPLGIDNTNGGSFPFYVYVAGTGTPEAALITGGTCGPSGGTSGTIQFTPANSHTAGFTVQSATTGIQEADVDACAGNLAVCANVSVILRPNAGGSGNNTFPFVAYSPVFWRGSNSSLTGLGGASIAVANTRAGIVLSTVNSVKLSNLRFLPESGFGASAAITNVACASTTATITTTLNPAVGDTVDIQFTASNAFYWGTHKVVTASGSQFTYTVPNCTGAYSGASAGFVAEQFANIEDNGQATIMENIQSSFGAAPYNGRFNNGIVVLNDQDAFIEHANIQSGSCGATYCGSAIYAPGPFATNPAVLKVVDSDLTLNCGYAGVTSYGGNTVDISNTVIQGYNLWAVNASTLRGGFGTLTTRNVYYEFGNCTNPFFTPNSTSVSLMYGQPMSIIGGEVGSASYKMPQFATGGATTYYYYLVVHNASGGCQGVCQSAPLYIGSAAPSGNAVTVTWPAVLDNGATLNYDIIRSTDNANAPITANCAGGSTSACGSRTLAQAQCTTIQCTFSDDVSQNTSSYTVLLPDANVSGSGGATYSPTFAYFPGLFILQNNATLTYLSGNVNSSALISAGAVMATNGIGYVFTDGPSQKLFNYVRINGAASSGSGGVANGASASVLLYDPQTANQPSNMIGKLTFTNGAKGLSQHSYSQGSYIISLFTQNSDQVMAASDTRRAVANAGDSGFAVDTGASSNMATWGLGYTNPVHHDFYVNSYADGSSWLERLTSALKEYKVNVQVDNGFSLTLAGITGSTQCLNVNSSGVISGTGALCSGVSGFQSLTDGVNINWNAGTSGPNTKVTIAGNRTLNLSGLANGGSYQLIVTQDATGSRTLTLGTGCTWKIRNGGGGAIVLSSTANASDMFTFTYDGTNCWGGVGLNFN